MKNLFVVCGPTCVGKTSISLHLAQYLDVPIINADSRQLFAEIPIGTAAPTQEEQQLVKHYFVGTLHLNDYYSASKYECDVLNLLTPPGELNHYENALMSGGSMMYIDAVCNGIDDIPTIDEETRDTLRQRLETEGLDPLIEELRLLDPEYFKIVDRRNTRRVVHALEICYMTGKTYTSFRVNEHKHRDFSIVKIGLTRPREELYSRINERVDLMMEQGLEEEARAVYCHKGANSLNTVGYRELFDYIEGKYTLSEAVERIKGATRRYCRKQLTWLKRDPSIKWFHPDERDAIISYIDTNR